jgi:hypothetical protein
MSCATVRTPSSARPADDAQAVHVGHDLVEGTQLAQLSGLRRRPRRSCRGPGRGRGTKRLDSGVQGGASPPGAHLNHGFSSIAVECTSDQRRMSSPIEGLARPRVHVIVNRSSEALRLVQKAQNAHRHGPDTRSATRPSSVWPTSTSTRRIAWRGRSCAIPPRRRTRPMTPSSRPGASGRRSATSPGSSRGSTGSSSIPVATGSLEPPTDDRHLGRGRARDRRSRGGVADRDVIGAAIAALSPDHRSSWRCATTAT